MQFGSYKTKNDLYCHQVQFLGYQPGLDGLRAVAIMLVLFLHAHFQLGKYGFIGVDLFFTLSGFLITTLLLEEYRKKNQLYIRAFLLRRAFRLLPALLLVLLFVYCYSFTVQNEVIKSGIQNELLASLFYLNNISWLWGWGNDTIILGHTWSLAVEEQFYLFWPFILILFLSFKILRSLETVLIVSIITSFVCKCFIADPVYNSLVKEPIFIGCLFAILRFRCRFLSRFPVLIFYLAFAVFIIAGLFSLPFIKDLFASNAGRNIWGLLSVILIGGVLVHPQSLLVRFLASSFMVWIGRISYSLYLWHLPVFRLFHWHSVFSDSISFVLKFLITLLLAFLSWNYLEKPAIKWGRIRFSSK